MTPVMDLCIYCLLEQHVDDDDDDDDDVCVFQSRRRWYGWWMGLDLTKAVWRCCMSGAGGRCATTSGTKKTETWSAGCSDTEKQQRSTRPGALDKVHQDTSFNETSSSSPWKTQKWLIKIILQKICFYFGCFFLQTNILHWTSSLGSLDRCTDPSTAAPDKLINI